MRIGQTTDRWDHCAKSSFATMFFQFILHYKPKNSDRHIYHIPLAVCLGNKDQNFKATQYFDRLIEHIEKKKDISRCSNGRCMCRNLWPLLNIETQCSKELYAHFPTAKPCLFFFFFFFSLTSKHTDYGKIHYLSSSTTIAKTVAETLLHQNPFFFCLFHKSGASHSRALLTLSSSTKNPFDALPQAFHLIEYVVWGSSYHRHFDQDKSDWSISLNCSMFWRKVSKTQGRWQNRRLFQSSDSAGLENVLGLILKDHILDTRRLQLIRLQLLHRTGDSNLIILFTESTVDGRLLHN